MTLLTVSDEQARLIAEASSPIVLVDSRGRELGQVTRAPVAAALARSPGEPSNDEWAEAKLQMEIYQREGGSFYTTQEVLEHLKSLEKE